MKTRNEQNSARSILSSASGENLLLLAILSGRKQRTEIESVLDKRALGFGQAKSQKRRAAAA
ncbi:MAG: hypothetical protein KF805_09550 [Phycisphaeraceae bacterium]|nr:hypothetical protein [Phycisphaeraceae bacterium]